MTGYSLQFNVNDDTREFCIRTSGTYVQLNSIIFMILLFGLPQSIYYGANWCHQVKKNCWNRRPEGADDMPDFNFDEENQNEPVRPNLNPISMILRRQREN